VQENGHPSQQGSLQSDSHPQGDVRITNQSSRRGTVLRLERLVMRAIRAQSDAVTKVLTAQSEFFMRMVEADRERQARMETKLDCLLERLDQSLSPALASTAGNKSIDKDRDQDARLNRLLDRLDWAIPPPASRPLEISNRNQETKLDSLLDKLDRLIPVLNPQALKSQHTTEYQPE